MDGGWKKRKYKKGKTYKTIKKIWKNEIMTKARREAKKCKQERLS